MGRRSAWAKSRSVVVERMPPVIASAAVCCIVSIFFAKSHAPQPFCFDPLPGSRCLVAHTSDAYISLGIATPS